jgi:hypothetical protein
MLLRIILDLGIVRMMLYMQIQVRLFPKKAFGLERQFKRRAWVAVGVLRPIATVERLKMIRDAMMCRVWLYLP